MDFEAILSRPFRWPKAGDKLFITSPRWDGNAHIEQYGRSRLVLMMSGYKHGADLMVERSAEHRYDRDTLVFPILFNYRQYIELSLKYLIATYGRTVGVEAIWNSHDLTRLWTTFLEVLDGYGERDSDGSDGIVGEIVAEFAKVDPKSFSYRYPVDIKGQPIELTHDRLDLPSLADVMQAVDGYFNGCDGYLDHLKQAGP